jgi:hypothetical protein
MRLNRGFWVSIVLALVSLCLAARAEALVRDLSIEYEHFTGAQRFLEVPQEHVLDQIALNIRLEPLSFLYVQNRVHLLGTARQVVWVGDQVEFGLTWMGFDFYRLHHSQHAVGAPEPSGGYPLYDGWGLRKRLFP